MAADNTNRVKEGDMRQSADRNERGAALGGWVPAKISKTEEEEEGRAMAGGGGWGGTTTKGMMYVDSVFYGGVGRKKS